MKYLVTGGAGFIGKNFLDFSTSFYPAVIDKKGSPSVDITTDKLKKYFKGHDVVIHLAALSGVSASVKDPIKSFEENALGTLRCLEAARKAGVKKFIFASSGGTVLGKQFVPLSEDLCPNPASPYGASKLAGEGCCKSYFHTYGLETVILRFSNVYGPYSIHKDFNLIPAFIMRAIDNKTCYINGDGEITKDYIFVADLVKAITLAAKTPNIGGQVFQIATGINSSINEVVEILNKLSQKYLSRKLKIKHRNERVGDVKYSCDILKARGILGFDPQFSLEEGLDITFRWFVQNYGG